MTLSNLIWQSYALPITRIGTVVKVFWLPACLWAAYVIGLEFNYRSDQETFSELFWMWILFPGIIFAIVMASCLVSWHRFLIKDEQPARQHSWLDERYWSFLWTWVWLGAAAVMFMIGVAVTVWIAMVAVNNAWADSQGLNLTWDNNTVATLVVSAALGTLLVSWLLPKTFLSLAAIAVGESDEYRQALSKSIDSKERLRLVTAIVATTVPLVVIGFGIPTLLEPNEGAAPLTPLYIVATIVAELANFFAIIVFASMLSLYYRHRISR